MLASSRTSAAGAAASSRRSRSRSAFSVSACECTDTYSPAAEARELASSYERRGLDAALAQQVAQQLMAHDALGAHARDELEISSAMAVRPVQAALTSAAAFAAGAALPLVVAAVAPASSLLYWVAGTALVFLALLGGVAAHTGGAGVLVGAWRVTFWGALAMAITAGVGALFGAPV